MALMAIVWSLLAQFVNGRKSGSVTLNFVEGRFSTSEERIVARY